MIIARAYKQERGHVTLILAVDVKMPVCYQNRISKYRNYGYVFQPGLVAQLIESN
jgi:hypothetical protein